MDFSEARDSIPKLLQQTNLSFLIGAGCSTCADLPLITKLTDRVLENLDPTKMTDPVEKDASELLLEVRDGFQKNWSSIEDYLSEIQDIKAILDRQCGRGVADPVYRSPNGREYHLQHLKVILPAIKTTIKEILGSNVKTVAYHRKFFHAIHTRLRAGRDQARPINYFSLNYDTLIEDALALEGVSFNDGFVGGATAWWDPTRFAAEADVLGGGRRLQAKVFKLHGSIDWVKPSWTDFPMRVRRTLPAGETYGDGEPVVIYPASVKYRETQNDPYALMMQHLRTTLLHTQDHVLCVMGYSFGDEHINVEIGAALRRNTSGLSLIAFLGGDDLPPALKEWVAHPETKKQIQVFGKSGLWKNGENILPGSTDLPWYKFEYLAQFLSGEAI